MRVCRVPKSSTVYPPAESITFYRDSDDMLRTKSKTPN